MGKNEMLLITLCKSLDMQPIVFDIIGVRKGRQHTNNTLAEESITRGDLPNNINVKEFQKVLTELKLIDIDEKELLQQCRSNKLVLKLLAGRIAIQASRQGCKDESMQIATCKETFSRCGIDVKQISSTSMRPTKDGELLTKKEMLSRNIKIEDCLKSFDAQFNGKITGFIFAKIVIGSGGHQDNVFEETYTICEWIVNFTDKTKTFIVMIDTDLIEKYNKLIKRYENHKNIIIGNHSRVQQQVIDAHYDESK